MSTGFYLLDHPNPHGDHFHRQRQGPILAIVLHITAGLEDLDSTDDHSAEKTAAYAASTDRAVSWHSGSDTDTAFDLLPDDHVAFHCKGYNTHTLGHEISKTTADWRTVSGLWVANTLDQAARHLAPKATRHGIPLRRCTRAELDRAKATGSPCGFVAHADLDPTRRRDPGYTAPPPNGDTFPWQRFLDLVHRHTRPTHQEDLLMPAAKDDDDARRALIRQWCWTFWGKPPSVAGQQELLVKFRADGADLTLATITDHPNAKAFRAKA